MIKRLVLAAVVAAGIAPALVAPASAAPLAGCGKAVGGLQACIDLVRGELVATGIASPEAKKGVQIEICRQHQACTPMTPGLKLKGWPDEKRHGNFEAVVFNGKHSAKSLLLSIPFRTPA